MVTVHELSVINLSQFNHRQNVEVCKNSIVSEIEWGSEIIFDSELVRRVVAATVGVTEALVPEHRASDARWRPTSKGDCRPALDSLSLRYRGIFLYAGTVEPRKNC